MQKPTITFLTVLALCLVSSPCWSQESPTPSDAALTKAIRDAEIVDADSSLTAKIDGLQSVITTDRHPKATEDDCKIDATLIAKAVFEKHKKLAKVKINFVGAKSTTTVSISAGDIAAFNNGGISEKQLLGGIDVTTSPNGAPVASTSNPNAALDAPDAERPIDPSTAIHKIRGLRNMIRTLRQAGTGTGEFQKKLEQINQLLSENRTSDAAPLIDRLEDILREQEKAAKQAKFRPVPVGASWQGGGARHLDRPVLATQATQPNQSMKNPPIAQKVNFLLVCVAEKGGNVGSYRQQYNDILSNGGPEAISRMTRLWETLAGQYPETAAKMEYGWAHKQGKHGMNSR